MSTSPVVDLVIDKRSAGPLLSWCPRTNLLAVQVSAEQGRLGVCIVDPSTPEETVSADLPSAGTSEQLLYLAWSPLRTEVLLAAATTSGGVYIYTQQSASLSEQPTSLNQWYCSKAFQTPSPPVTVRWLQAPGPWEWEMASAQSEGHQLHGIEARFRPHAVPGRLWLRPSKLCCAAVMQDRTIQIFWRGMGGQWLGHQPFSYAAASPVSAADVTVASDGSLWLAAWAKGADSIAVMQYAGDPTAVGQGGPPMQLVKSFQLKLDFGERILAASFSPGASGLTVTIGISLYESAYLLRFSPGDPAWKLTSRQSLGSYPADDVDADAAPFAHASDSSLLVAVSNGDGSHSLALHEPASMTILGEVPLPGPCCGVALSANSEATAVALAGGAVQVYCLPSVPPALAGEHLANRLAWSFLNRTSQWDVITSLRKAGPEAMRAALQAADDAIHAQPQSTRAIYGHMLTQAKLQLLRDAQDPAVLCIRQDLCARCFLAASEGIVALVHKAIDMHKSQQKANPAVASKQLSFSPTERAIVSGWAGWADSYAAFFLQCIRLWVADKERRQQPGTGHATEPDTLPCIRLLADSAFTNQLRHALTLQVLLKRNSNSKKEGGAKDAVVAKLFIAAIEGIQSAISKANAEAGREAPLSGDAAEVAGAELKLAAEAVESFQGVAKLHYPRSHGHVDWRAVQAALQSPAVEPALKELAEPDAGLIPSMARRLGLLYTGTVQQPQRHTPWRSVPLLPFEPDIGFASLFHGADNEGCSALKRKRWQVDRDIALGLLAEASSQQPIVDSISGHNLGWQREPSYITTAGLSATAELRAELLARDTVASGTQECRRAWVHACPVTGQFWKRAHHNPYPS